MADQAPKDLIGFLDYYLVTKAPFQIPDTGRELIVKIGSWLCVILLVLMLPLLLLMLGIGTALMPVGGVAYATGFSYLTVIVLVQFALMAASLPGLFARKMAGWRLMFYAQIVSFLSSILFGNILGAILGALIAMYILFQVRGLYK